MGESRVKEHGRVKLLDYWVWDNDKQVRLPLQPSEYTCYFGQVVNFVLERVLKKLNFPWKYNAEIDRLEYKNYDTIKESIQKSFSKVTEEEDIVHDDIISFVTYGSKKDGKFAGFITYVEDNNNLEKPDEYPDMEFICFITIQLI